jgi:endoglucanase
VLRGTASTARWALAVSLGLSSLAACSTRTDLGPAAEPSFGPSYLATSTGLDGRAFFLSDDTQAARWAKANRATGWLQPITGYPQARWVNGPDDLPSLMRASRQAAASRRLLTLVAYYVPDRGCAHHTQGASSAAAYRSYIAGVVASLGLRRALIVLEPDAVAADCYTTERAALLAEATATLTAAGHYVYIDAGHSGWRLSGLMAERLVASGITQAAGFAVNVSARDSTAVSRAYGEELSDLVGHRPFVVDASRNGLDLDAAAAATAQWCNPVRQALGEPPRVTSVGHNVGLLWIKNPGESDGNGPTCAGETAWPGLFSPRQARRLIAGAPWATTTDRSALPEEKTLPWTH